MKKLLTNYIKTESMLVILERLAFALLAFMLVYSTLRVIECGLDMAIDSLESVGILVSVLLASQVAKRQLISSSISTENSQRSNIVKVTHRLLALINELKNKIGYTSNFFTVDNMPLNIVAQAREDILVAYKALYDKDIYEYISGESVDLIDKMSGSIFGLTGYLDNLYQRLSVAGNTTLPKLENLKKPPIEELLNNLNLLDSQIRELRASVDLPSELVEQFNNLD